MEAIKTSFYGSLAITIILLLISIVALYYGRKIYRADKQLGTALKKLNHIASFDRLTGLRNREHFFFKLDEKIADAKRSGESFYLCLLDIDDFKKINDEHQHGFGDKVLKVSARHFTKFIQEGEKVARYGGDEFIFICHAHSQKALENRLSKLTRFYCDVTQDYKNLLLNTSIGVYKFDNLTTTLKAEQLFSNTELALDKAKETGKSRVCFYETSMSEAVKQEIEIEKKLCKAIENNELQLFYQAKYDLETQERTGFEALVRWPQKDGSMISPGLFIPIAEKSRLILHLDHWVFNAACQQYLQWQDKGMDYQINVNLSGRFLSEVDLEKEILKKMQQLGIPMNRIGIEITEHSLMSVKSAQIEKLQMLRDAGITLFLDDFGTGYSSLSYLQKFPVSVLKIDQSFVRDAPHNPRDYELMRAIITMGHSLGLRVLAEGIETEEHEKVVKALGCNRGQGYLYHRPQAANDLI